MEPSVKDGAVGRYPRLTTTNEARDADGHSSTERGRELKNLVPHGHAINTLGRGDGGPLQEEQGTPSTAH